VTGFTGSPAKKALRSILIMAVGLSLTDALARADENLTTDQILKSLRSGPRFHDIEHQPIERNRPNIDLEIAFEYNSTKASAASMHSLQVLGKELMSNPDFKGMKLMIAGHTDAVGGEAFNQSLSERRANAIKHYLVENFGIADSDLIAVGYGKRQLRTQTLLRIRSIAAFRFPTFQPRPIRSDGLNVCSSGQGRGNVYALPLPSLTPNRDIYVSTMVADYGAAGLSLHGPSKTVINLLTRTSDFDSGL
jgi:hypothetical protein